MMWYYGWGFPMTPLKQMEQNAELEETKEEKTGEKPETTSDIIQYITGDKS